MPDQLDPHKCPHKHLQWGSGSFYLICQDCQQFWVAKRSGGTGDLDLDFEQGANVSHRWTLRVEKI